MALPELHDREGWRAFLQKKDWRSISSEEICVAFRAIDGAHSKVVEYALFKEVSRRLEKVARRYAGADLMNRGGDVAEAVTSRLLQALRTPDDLDGISLCHAFGFVVCRRTVDYARSERAQRRLVEPLEIDELGEVKDASAPTPARLDQDQLLDLRGALDSVCDGGRRRIVELRLEGWGIKEIADGLGIQVDAAIYRLNAGLGEVINHLAGEAHR